MFGVVVVDNVGNVCFFLYGIDGDVWGIGLFVYGVSFFSFGIVLKM